MRHKMHEDFKNNMVGQRFNNLVVMSHHSREKGYLCLCDCGNTTVQRSNLLKSGKVKGCGCLNAKPRPNKRKPNNYAMKNRAYDNYKRMAKRKGREFSISLETFSMLIDSPCIYCGASKSLRTWQKGSEYFHNGVDRVDNSVGYVDGNCVACCKICNNSKASLSLEDWTGWLVRITQFRKLGSQEES